MPKLGGTPRLGRAEGLAPRLVVRVVHQPEPPEGPAHVVLEVVHLVEVRAPVQGAVPHARPAEQIDGVPQPLAAVGEVPDDVIGVAVEVAVGAGHVAVLAQARVEAVVEQLLAALREMPLETRRKVGAVAAVIGLALVYVAKVLGA